jgi:hypothetical protein
MNVRKISVAPLEPLSATLPKHTTVTKKATKTSVAPKVSSIDLEHIRDSIMPAKSAPKPQILEVKEETTPLQPAILEPPPPRPTPNPKTRIVKVTQNEGEIDQYEADIEVGTMFRRVDQHVEETLNEEKFIRQTLLFTTAVTISSLSGILLILIGFAESEAFQNIEPNVGVVCLGFFLQIPVIYWIYRKIYPTKENIEIKKRLKTNRKYRSKALKRDDIKYIEETNVQERFYDENEKLAMKNRYLYTQKFKEKNPLGYPTLGVTRHRWDDS